MPAQEPVRPEGESIRGIIMKKKRVGVISVALLTTCAFGIEPGELVKLYRASRTNDAASREFYELARTHRDLISEAVSRMNGLELMLMYNDIDSVSVTSTNLTVTFRDMDALTLTPDKEATVVQHRQGGLFVTPVSFKDKGMGFRIKDSFAHMADERLNIAYVALSDTPTEVSEKDVAMIMKKGEWKTAEEYHAIVEREDRLQELWFKYQDKRSEAKKLFQGEELTNRLSVIEYETKLERDRIESGEQAKERPLAPGQPAAVETPPEPPAVPTPEPVEAQAPVLEDGTPDIADGEDGQSEEKSETGNLWLYALIPLVLSAAALYFIRRRPKM